MGDTSPDCPNFPWASQERRSPICLNFVYVNFPDFVSGHCMVVVNSKTLFLAHGLQNTDSRLTGFTNVYIYDKDEEVS